MTDTVMGKMGCAPILFIKVSVKKIKGAAHKNGDIDGTWIQSLNWMATFHFGEDIFSEAGFDPSFFVLYP